MEALSVAATETTAGDIRLATSDGVLIFDARLLLDVIDVLTELAADKYEGAL